MHARLVIGRLVARGRVEVGLCLLEVGLYEIEIRRLAVAAFFKAEMVVMNDCNCPF